MENKREMPEWLKALLIIGGIVLIGYLLAKLLDYLFSEDAERKRRIFISHSWRYDKDYWSLIKKFETYNFDYYNHSIPQEKAIDEVARQKIENAIRNKILYCSNVLVLGGSYANNYWIKKEVEIAKQLNKKVIAIRPWNGNSIPKYLDDAADRVVGFNAKTIIEEIKK
jgi:hypothetical protein